MDDKDASDKLEAPSNPVASLKDISKLVNQIAKAGESGSSVAQSKIMRQLRDKWSEKEPVLSVTACQGLLVLSDNGMVPVSAAIEMLVVAMPNLKNYAGVTSTIGTLLLWETKSRAGDELPYSCPYGITKNQHPLIKLLLHCPDTWPDVYTVIQNFSCGQDAERISNYQIPLLRPVFEFVLCDPQSKPYLPSSCRRQLWSYLLKTLSNTSMRELIMRSLQWMQFNEKERTVEAGCLLEELCEAAVVVRDVPLCLALAPLAASHSRKMVSLAIEPSAFLRVLCQLVKIAPDSSSCVVLLLADTITACPSAYLHAVISACQEIIEMEATGYVPAPVAAYAVIFSLVPWFSAPSVFTEEAMKKARNLVDRIYSTFRNVHQQTKRLLCNNRWFQQLRHCDRDVHIAAAVCRLAERWLSKSDVSDWLNHLRNAQPKAALKLLPLIGALLLSHVRHNEDEESDITDPEHVPVLKTLSWLVEHNPSIVQHVFLLLTHCLTKEKRPTMQIALLRALTDITRNQDTVPFTLAMLRAMKCDKHSTTNLAIDLYYRLWVLQPRCFSFLHEALLKDAKNESYKISWQTDLARAATIKKMCLQKPEAHTQDLLPIVSSILSQHSTSAGALQAALCLDSIVALSRLGVLDVVNAWRSLATKLANEKRPMVVVSLCDLLGLIGHRPTGDKNQNSKIEAVVEEAIVKLWHYITAISDDQIVNAALRGLSQFDVSRMTLKMVSPYLRKHVTLDRDFIKTPVDTTQNPVDVYTYVPEQVWKNLIVAIGARPNCRDVLCETLACWVGAELTSIPRSVFVLLPDRPEPTSYIQLSKGHIVRALYNLASCQETKSIALDALSRKLPRQLPPVDWHFLEVTMNEATDEKVRCSCLTIAAKQCSVSRSAAQLLVNYMSNCNVETDKLECEALFSELHCLGKVVQSKEIGAYVIKGLQCALASYTSEEDKEGIFLQSLLKKLEVTLTKTVTDDYTRTVASIVENFSQALKPTCSVYPAFVSCASRLPIKNRDRLTSPSLWWDMSLEKLQLATLIQSAVLDVEDFDMPLALLNDCIDSAASAGHAQQDFVLGVMYDVVMKLRDHESNPQWMCQLIGRIQRVTINDAHLETKKQVVQMLCDVLLLSAIVLSGHEAFSADDKLIATSREERLALFPQALAGLLQISSAWSAVGPLMINWLQYMRHSDTVTQLLGGTFSQTLVALRYEESFRTTKFWMIALT